MIHNTFITSECAMSLCKVDGLITDDASAEELGRNGATFPVLLGVCMIHQFTSEVFILRGPVDNVIEWLASVGAIIDVESNAWDISGT